VTTGRGWYVKATRYAFPHSWRLISGPFDDSGPAFPEAARIRPFYPEAHLSVVLEVAKTLPERRPRARAPGAEQEAPMFDLSRVAGRLAAAEAVAEFARERGATVNIENWDGEPDVDVWLPTLRATIGMQWHKQAPMPIISWHRAQRPLVGHLPGAWRQEGSFRNGKATSLPETWPALFEALEIGICAAVDGSAFDWERA